MADAPVVENVARQAKKIWDGSQLGDLGLRCCYTNEERAKGLGSVIKAANDPQT